VLGEEIATDAVIEAWGAAYQQLAELLIGLEEQIYADRENAPGGWRRTRAFQVALTPRALQGYRATDKGPRARCGCAPR